MSPIKEHSGKVFLKWIIPITIWNDFIVTEVKNKKQDSIFMGIGILILGIPALMFVKSASLIWAAAISIPLAVLIPYLRYVLTSKHLKQNARNVEALFYENKVVLNSKEFILLGDLKWVSKINVLEKNRLQILEITYNWKTSKGATFDEVRIPIPLEHIDDIAYIIRVYGLSKSE